MTTPLACPGTEGWQSLLDLDLEPDQLSRWERHLQSCPACQDRLDWAEADEEEFRERARRVGDPTAAPLDSTLTEFLERLQEGQELAPALATDPADLYFQRPSDRPDILGTLGVYEVREVIGQGGMGIVLKAYEPALQRLVAIKVLAPAWAQSAKGRQRFTREAQAAAAVCHEHIVPIYGVHESDGLPYLVMQYVPGESLQARLDQGGPLDVETIVRIGQQTALGLAAAHAQGLIHRDIKPANILLVSGGVVSGEWSNTTHHSPLTTPQVKIIDFGLARLVDEVGLTQNGVVAGTPEYMAPEQARGEPVDHRADLFSLGSVLYALSTGVPAFRAATPLAVLRLVSDTAPRPVRALNPEVPAWLEALITGLLVKDPAGRYQSAAEVAALLEGYLAHLCQPETVPPPELRPLAREASAGPPLPARRYRFRGNLAAWLRPPWLAVLVALAALGPCLFFFLQAAPPPSQPIANEFYCDFRGRQPLPSNFTLLGPDAGEVIKHEEKGLRISLPAKRRSNSPVGVTTTFAVAGDFEITGTYELLSIDRPPGGNGVAVALNVTTDSDLTKFGKISRCLRAQEGDVYQTEFWIKGDPDSGQHLFIPTTARAGQLRLLRQGSTLLFLVADGPDNDFREINRREFTTEDVEIVRFVANNSGSPAGLDLRLIDLRVRFDHVAPYKPFDKAKAFDWAQGWSVRPLLVGGIGLGLLLCALGMVFHVRRRARILASPGVPAAGEGSEEKPGPADPEAAAPFLAFPCPSCGKNLRARAALAGKSLKCAACGQVVRAPGTQEETDAAGPSPASRLPRRLGLLLLGSFSLLMLGLFTLGFLTADEKAKELHYDFRGRPLPADFQLFGDVKEEWIREDPAGLRITLPAGRKNFWSGGLSLPVSVPGDFEITTTFEILQAEVPPDGYGSGVLLAVNQNEVARVGSIVLPTGEQVIRCDRLNVGGNRGEVGDLFPRQAKAGKLRLKRTESILHFLWAPDDRGEDFEEIYHCEFGTQEITPIRLIATTSRKPLGLDVRFIDLRIKGATAGARSLWLLCLAGAILGVVLLVSLAVRLLRRGGGSAAPRSTGAAAP